MKRLWYLYQRGEAWCAGFSDPGVLKARLKRLWYLYQRAMWYVGVANSEIRKPLIFINDALILLTFLAVIGIKSNVPIISSVYVGVLILASIVGKILVVIGVVAYQTKIQNKENPQLMEILERVKKIEDRLKNNEK